jgi:hypothetical protein
VIWPACRDSRYRQRLTECDGFGTSLNKCRSQASVVFLVLISKSHQIMVALLGNGQVVRAWEVRVPGLLLSYATPILPPSHAYSTGRS